MNSDELKEGVLKAFRLYYDSLPRKSFTPGKTYINYSGMVSGALEWENVIKVAMERWITHADYSQQFENKIKKLLPVNHCNLVNSGSSANLLAVTALTSLRLLDRRLRPGDEVIIPACCFPTTIAPIVQNRLIPVLLDSDIGTYNINPGDVHRAISDRTKAIFVSHTLGNPVNMTTIMQIARHHNLWVIEDNCDSLCSTWNGTHTGIFGEIATLSFYPAHHITTGEGGAVVTNDGNLAKIVQSLRDWGRDCSCKPGNVALCNNRFGIKRGKLPRGYDHKYTFSHIGYNLKLTDFQSAIGLAQIGRLYEFVKQRKANFKTLYNALLPYKDRVVLPVWEKESDPAWFGFPITVSNRMGLIKHLERNKIQTRLLFAGNILKQPAFEFIKHRTIDDLSNADRIMNQTLFLGVYPGLNKRIMTYITDKLKEYFSCLK